MANDSYLVEIFGAIYSISPKFCLNMTCTSSQRVYWRSVINFTLMIYQIGKYVSPISVDYLLGGFKWQLTLICLQFMKNGVREVKWGLL